MSHNTKGGTWHPERGFSEDFLTLWVSYYPILGTNTFNIPHFQMLQKHKFNFYYAAAMKLQKLLIFVKSHIESSEKDLKGWK